MSMMDISNLSTKLTARNTCSQKFPMQFLVEYMNAVLDGETGELLEYRQLIQRPKYKDVWSKSFANEIGRLAQGIGGRVDPTNTIFFITKCEVPPGRFKDVTYGRIVYNYRNQKSEKHRTRLIVGGDRINYPDNWGTPTLDLLTFKLLLNSVISTDGARFMSIDIKDFYLNTPMARSEFMCLKLSNLPDNVIAHYKLHEKATNDSWVYVEIKRGMYGLPQAGPIAQQLLEKRLNKHGYKQSELTPGFGPTNGAPSVSPSVSTTSASNTWGNNTQIIS